ncbi:MAG: alpha/beta fold hydrolase [Alphaproteobacteria bacterium]|nr:alpha/beta fold hydrolase [Alphaproteobacteria bacterium]
MRPLDEWRDATQFMRFGELQAAWWTSGEQDPDKPSLLLIHGYPTSSWDWTAVWPRLAERFHLVAVDMIGFGLSDKPKHHRFSIMQQADLQEAILEHLGIGEAHLLVHDYGNTVAQELLARQIDRALSFRILSLVFLNGGLFPEQHRARASQKLGLSPLGPLLGSMMNKDRFRRALDEVFGPETKASDGEINGHWKLINERDGKKILHKLLHYIPERRAYRERWVGALKETSVPLRLIDGGADPVSGAHLYDYYLEQVPDADAVLLPSVGHYPHTEAPDEVIDAFLDFHRRYST